jgi:endogenous inhibitor of DNA gyrase (YacG/DUF329 family)
MPLYIFRCNHDMSVMPEPVVRSKSCPICRKPSAERFTPFCSRRCADVDLNRWLSGVYAVPAAEQDDPEAERPPRTEPE